MSSQKLSYARLLVGNRPDCQPLGRQARGEPGLERAAMPRPKTRLAREIDTLQGHRARRARVTEPNLPQVRPGLREVLPSLMQGASHLFDRAADKFTIVWLGVAAAFCRALLDTRP